MRPLPQSGTDKRRCSLKLRWLVTALLWFVAPLFAVSGSARNSRKHPPPELMLWSWFARDDLRFLKTRDIGVAYWALSLHFVGQSQVVPSPRTMPIWIAPDTYQMAVIRFDYDAWDLARRPAFSERQREMAVRMIAEIASLAHTQGVQIDFDAPRSAWPFYRHLLADVRHRLGPDIFLSMTALVSWCDTPQSWLAGLTVDEIVPMAFQMGQATPAITTMLQRGGQFAFPGCRASIGVRLGDGIPIHPRKNQRAYFFGQLPVWSPETVRIARETVLR